MLGCGKEGKGQARLTNTQQAEHQNIATYCFGESQNWKKTLSLKRCADISEIAKEIFTQFAFALLDRGGNTSIESDIPSQILDLVIQN